MTFDTLCRDPSVSDADPRAAMAEMKNRPRPSMTCGCIEN
jgi:hypothetical protein